jgi:hypothetical protein
MKMKYYKVRINSSAFQDIVVRANSKKEAEEVAMKKYNHDECPEFGGFFEVDKNDISDYKHDNNY